MMWAAKRSEVERFTRHGSRVCPAPSSVSKGGCGQAKRGYPSWNLECPTETSWPQEREVGMATMRYMVVVEGGAGSAHVVLSRGLVISAASIGAAKRSVSRVTVMGGAPLLLRRRGCRPSVRSLRTPGRVSRNL